MASPLLAGCVLLPPSADSVAGTYTADDATVVMAADGTCTVSNFPDSINVDSGGEPVFSAERFDSECTWKIARLLYSGAWELDVYTSPDQLERLDLDWLKPIGRTGCLVRSLGDPDDGDWWELCPAG